MTLLSRARKAALTAHVVSSVGWVGAVGAFLSLAVAGTSSGDEQTVRSAYVAMDVMAWFVILPLAFLSLGTGLVQALGTQWGLLRHYWVVAKLILTAVATVVLLFTMGDIAAVADLARADALRGDAHRGSRNHLTLHAGGGLAVLLLTTSLAIFKPRGLTRRGWRKQQELRESLDPGQGQSPPVRS